MLQGPFIDLEIEQEKTQIGRRKLLFCVGCEEYKKVVTIFVIKEVPRPEPPLRKIVAARDSGQILQIGKTIVKFGGWKCHE